MANGVFYQPIINRAWTMADWCSSELDQLENIRWLVSNCIRCQLTVLAEWLHCNLLIFNVVRLLHNTEHFNLIRHPAITFRQIDPPRLRHQIPRHG